MHFPIVPCHVGGHHEKVEGHSKKNFPALGAGNCAPPLSNSFRRHWSGNEMLNKKVLSWQRKVRNDEAVRRKCTAVNRIPSHSYRLSLAIWDHTVLPVTRHKWAYPALTPSCSRLRTDRKPRTLLKVNKPRQRPAAQMGMAKSDFCQMRQSRSGFDYECKQCVVYAFVSQWQLKTRSSAVAVIANCTANNVGYAIANGLE